MVSAPRKLTYKIHAAPALLATYDKATGIFRYHRDLLALFECEREDLPFWEILFTQSAVSFDIAQEIKEIFLTVNQDSPSFFIIYSLRRFGRYAFSFVYANEIVTLALQNCDTTCGVTQLATDELTGLIRRSDFCNQIGEINTQNPKTQYALFFFDVIKFKAINDIFGFAEGDKLLRYIGELLKTRARKIVTASRVSADRFAFLADVTAHSAEEIADKLIREIKQYELPFEISVNVGIYVLPKTDADGNGMLDKASLAQSVIKGSYTQPINYFTEALRDEMLSEQEISGEMNVALAEEQFLVYYQPQYNHSTGMLIGAEALVRWAHPEKGLIPPARFIPIFEKNGFISKLDFYVFEKATQFLRRSMDKNLSIVPISVNFSKHDIFFPDFVEKLEGIRQRYDVPAKYLHIELTESILIGNHKAVNEILRKLHACGYTVEMDDFGSGYSSLNVLKDLEFDVIKLDMLFLEDKDGSGRGGTILSSVVNMAKWLNIPVIAEGVETIGQADFLRSIGCNYIQGYLYSRPLPEQEYEKIVSSSHIGAMVPQMNLVDALNAANFWNPASQETLIFSNFVGAAVIFNYDRTSQKIEILRVNKKYLSELGMNLSERDIIHGDPAKTLDETNHKLYFETLEKAIQTGEEQECETWRTIQSPCCGEEHICIHSTVTVIGQSQDRFLFHSMVRNVTAEKQRFNSLLDGEKRFKMASEQVNIYFWEYTIATKEMRPCFRCMRDLGLPPLLRNYPDSAIERGIFPPEVADMYRDWHVQVANGVKELEAIIPLTPDRIPFRVRYTTEFDENGHPIKAYGSAALVVD